MSERIGNVATATTYAVSSGVTTFGALTLNEWFALGGLMLGFLTYFTNLYYKRKHYELARCRVYKEFTQEKHSKPLPPDSE